MMIDPTSLAAFQAVLLAGSFEGAATQPHLVRPVVSARFEGLGRRPSTSLNRRARPVAPTCVGRRRLNKGTR